MTTVNQWDELLVIYYCYEGPVKCYVTLAGEGRVFVFGLGYLTFIKSITKVYRAMLLAL